MQRNATRGLVERWRPHRRWPPPRPLPMSSCCADYAIPCQRAQVLHDANDVVVHLPPSPVVAKVSPSMACGWSKLEREMAAARYLVKAGAPVVAAPCHERGRDAKPRVVIVAGQRFSAGPVGEQEACVTVRPSAITARTALYVCSVTLNSLMRGSVRYQPGHLSDISRDTDRHHAGRFCRVSTGSAHDDGARAGSRTLNLGLKRLRARSVRECQQVSGMPSVLGFMTQQCRRVSGSLTACLREGVNQGVDGTLRCVAFHVISA